MGPADSVLNSVATPVCYCCVAFGAKFDTEREEGEVLAKITKRVAS